MALLTWAGQAFDDNDGDFLNLPDYLPAVFFTTDLFGFEPVIAYYQRNAFHPVIQEFFASYLEMREKSPPFTLP